MPKKTPTRSKYVQRSAVHKSCSKKRTILREHIRSQAALIEDLHNEVILLSLTLKQHKLILEMLASESKLELDPFGAIHDKGGAESST